jgi:hypothetical protein
MPANPVEIEPDSNTDGGFAVSAEKVAGDEIPWDQSSLITWPVIAPSTLFT